MSYRNYRRSKPQKRTIIVKYASPCACCGATIKAGEMADYYPVGYLGATTAKIRHCDNIAGDSPKCATEIERRMVNDYAGNGLDQRYEDQCADICGR